MEAEPSPADDRGSREKPHRRLRVVLAVTLIVLIASLSLAFIHWEFWYPNSCGVPGTPCGPVTVPFSYLNSSSTGRAYYDNLSIGDYGQVGEAMSLTTYHLQFSLRSTSGQAVPASPTPCGAAPMSHLTNCSAPATGWYVVLGFASGGVLASFPVNSTPLTGWSPGEPVPVSGGDILVIISAMQLHGTSDVLSISGGNGVGVTGSTTL